MSTSRSKTAINRRISLANQKFEELGTEVTKLVEVIGQLQQSLDEANEALKIVNYPGLHFPELREALCELTGQKSNGWIPSILATAGSGPWDAEEFDAFLRTRGITPFSMPGNNVNGLIIGTSGWDENDVAEQIFNRTSSSLKIYTQELFIFGLCAGKDPYDFLEQEAVDEVGLNHPAIQFILNKSFSWPWQESSDEDSLDIDWDIDSVDWSAESILKKMGYNASLSGPNQIKRRQILQKVFESDILSKMESEQQVKRWGSRKSALRLHTMSNFLAWLINLQGNEKPAAREKWSSDLRWLRTEFYQVKMGFKWPEIPLSSTIGAQTAVRPQVGNSKADFMKLYFPSDLLAAVIGSGPKSRVEVVKQLWIYIKKHNLQNPNDKRKINADVKFKALFGKPQIGMFEMAGLISKHLLSSTDSKINRQSKAQENHQNLLPVPSRYLKPRHALAVIIGSQPKSSFDTALYSVREYISRNKLIKEGQSLIQADDYLFALTGQKYIKESDLLIAIQNNLY